MKLASLKDESPDGRLVVVSRDLARCLAVPAVAPTLQAALDAWDRTGPGLAAAARSLAADPRLGRPFDPETAAAPLPRAHQWLDGSAYLNHVALVRKSRGAGMPPNAETDPLMYQGGSDSFLGPCDPAPFADEAWGIDFESEVAVVTDAVPMSVSRSDAGRHIVLLMLATDWSLRNLIPDELAKGFGFVHGKPATAFTPVAATPDELGEAWDGGRVHLALRTELNGTLFGRPNAGAEMTFDFPALIAHAAKTRRLGPGTIIGSGTVSNRDRSLGFSCIAETRAVETIEQSRPMTPFLKFGDRVRVEMIDRQGATVFGAIDQEVVDSEIRL